MVKKEIKNKKDVINPGQAEKVSFPTLQIWQTSTQEPPQARLDHYYQSLDDCFTFWVLTPSEQLVRTPDGCSAIEAFPILICAIAG